MASGTTNFTPTNFTDRIKIGNDNIAIGASAYGVCSTAANTAAKEVTIPGFYLNDGITIHVKFEQTNSAINPTLSVSSGTAYPIRSVNWTAGSIVSLTFDGEKWINADSGIDTVYDVVPNGGLLLNNSNQFGVDVITNAMLQHSSFTVNGLTIALGDTVSGSALANALALTNALHFVGIAVNNTLTNGSTYDPLVQETGVTYTGAVGDIVLDSTTLREYLWYSGQWVELGLTLSAAYDTGANINTNIPTWVSRIIQYTDGHITAETQSMGILPISHGGIGTSSLNADQVLLTNTPDANSDMQVITRAYTDNTSQSALLSTSSNFITERSVYFGLPFINTSHAYTSNDTIFAPVTQGESYQLLRAPHSIPNQVGDEGVAPVWANAALLIETNTSSILELGKAQISPASNITGGINLFTASGESHYLYGTSTTTEYTHFLPNSNGYLVQTTSTAAVGSATQPIFVDANGIVTAITYTAHRIYYPSATNSFTASGHYISDTKIAIASTSEPTDTLYVGGATTITGITSITNTTDVVTTGVNATAGALIVSGGVTIHKKLHVLKPVTFEETLDVTGASTLTGAVGIGTTPSNSHQLNVLGNSQFAGNILRAPTSASIKYNLGASGAGWDAVYIGANPTYGTEYTPIYWLDGVPTPVSILIKVPFTIANGRYGVQLNHDSFTTDTYVVSIVVETGESNLNGILNWSTAVAGAIKIASTTTVSGPVTGYILIVQKGTDLSPTSTTALTSTI